MCSNHVPNFRTSCKPLDLTNPKNWNHEFLVASLQEALEAEEYEDAVTYRDELTRRRELKEKYKEDYIL